MRRIAGILEDAYGSPDHGNKSDPLDELVYIVLSQMTTAPSFARVYDRLKEEVPNWDLLLSMPVRRLKRLIGDAGLSNQKAPRIRAIVRRAVSDFGSADLSDLARLPDDRVLSYLTSLPGVGIKTAKCVMMYSLGRRVLPVDTHVARVTQRLQILRRGVTATTIHAEAEAAVPAGLRYSFHVNAVAHGQQTCLAMRPRCDGCALRRLCPSRRDSV